MCGIAGISYSKDSSLSSGDCLRYLDESIQSLRRRGPDDNGIYVSDSRSFFAAHTRLSIQDLDPRSKQPFHSADGRFIISFNGEIYNFNRLRKKYLGDQKLNTESDTEVLLRLFIKFGPSCLNLLRGMFVFTIWDNLKQELFLARDPYGIKPLYFYSKKGSFVYSSQAKSLGKFFSITPFSSEPGSVGFILSGSVPEPFTIFKDVYALKKGSYMIVREGSIINETEWFNFKECWQSGNTYPLEEIPSHINSSVKDHLISDVPVCIFLSAGIDSLSICNHIKDSGIELEGLNIAFKEFENTSDDESVLAKKAANDLGFKFHKRIINKQEFFKDIDKIFDAMDLPSIDGLNTWYASKFARELNYKVALSGLGGDELFCGYDSFKRIPRIIALRKMLVFRNHFHSIYKKSFSMLGKLFDNMKFKYLFDHIDSVQSLYFLRRCIFLPHELPIFFSDEFINKGLSSLNEFYVSSKNIDHGIDGDIQSKISYFESNFYMSNQLLRDSDWASMYHSVELRTPLVDSQLLHNVAPHTKYFSNFMGKKILANSSKTKVPDYIINKSKTGFSFPLDNWLNQLITEKEISISDHLINNSWSRKWAAFQLAKHKTIS